MLDFARKPTPERFAFFEEAGERKDIGPHIIEKDFWGCWLLRLPLSGSHKLLMANSEAPAVDRNGSPGRSS